VRLLARKLNLQRRQLTQQEKRDVIKEQLAETPERSDRWIADDLGSGHELVKRMRNELWKKAQVRDSRTRLWPEKVLGRDGVWQAYRERKKPDPQPNPPTQEPEPGSQQPESESTTEPDPNQTDIYEQIDARSGSR
jgi:hypothetical protein